MLSMLNLTLGKKIQTVYVILHLQGDGEHNVEDKSKYKNIFKKNKHMLIFDIYIIYVPSFVQIGPPGT